LAAYLSAQRAHSVMGWQAFLVRYGSSARAADAKNAIAAIYEKSAESALAEYRNSAASGDLSRLRQAQQQEENAEKSVAGYAPAAKLQEQINRELDALLESDRSNLQRYRKALQDHSLGYVQLAAAKQHNEQVLEVSPQYAPALALRAEIAVELRKLGLAVQ